MMGTYVVTGGTGFIGKALLAHLRRAGHTVFVASRLRHQHDAMSEWVEFDLRDWATANNIANISPDGVFHLAWSTTPSTAEQLPASDISVNLSGTINLLVQLAAIGNTKVVLASSGGTIYGNAGQTPIPEWQAPKPISVYGLTKLAMENYATNGKIFANLDVRIARISNPFGALQAPTKMQGAATIFARKILDREQIQIWGDGTYVRDYVDVADIASGLSAIMEIDRGELADLPIFNLGSGRGLSLLELIRHLETNIGHKADVRFMPKRNFDVPVNILDVSRLMELSRWRPGDLEEQLGSLVKSLQDKFGRHHLE